jgi:hypothetical protein
MSAGKRLVLLLSDAQHAALKRLGGESNFSVGVYARSILLDHIKSKNPKLLQDKRIEVEEPPVRTVVRQPVVSEAEDAKMREIFGEEWKD